MPKKSTSTFKYIYFRINYKNYKKSLNYSIHRLLNSEQFFCCPLKYFNLPPNKSILGSRKILISIKEEIKDINR